MIASIKERHKKLASVVSIRNVCVPFSSECTMRKKVPMSAVVTLPGSASIY